MATVIEFWAKRLITRTKSHGDVTAEPMMLNLRRRFHGQYRSPEQQCGVRATAVTLARQVRER